MIFIGDIAIPFDISATYPQRPDCFSGAVIANLEGAFVRSDVGTLNERRALFNHPSVLKYMRGLGVRAVSLANNHILDISPDSLNATREALDANDIVSCGAGVDIQEAAQPCMLEENGQKIVFLAFGWQVIQCQPAGMKQPGVNPLEPSHVLRSVLAARSRYPDARLVLLMHWDYELELYPQPVHRQLAFDAVDMGADVVVGAHSHCVQGVEVYKGAPIVYGLGNWLIPNGCFCGGSLVYPPLAKLELAFEWNSLKNRMVCHWFEYQEEDHSIQYRHSEVLEDSEKIRELTPYSGMAHEEYIQWFKQHRRKNLFLPVYSDYKNNFLNGINDLWVEKRQDMISVGVALGILGKPR